MRRLKGRLQISAPSVSFSRSARQTRGDNLYCAEEGESPPRRATLASDLDRFAEHRACLQPPKSRPGDPRSPPPDLKRRIFVRTTRMGSTTPLPKESVFFGSHFRHNPKLPPSFKESPGYRNNEVGRGTR